MDSAKIDCNSLQGRHLIVFVCKAAMLFCKDMQAEQYKIGVFEHPECIPLSVPFRSRHRIYTNILRKEEGQCPEFFFLQIGNKKGHT